MRKSLRALGQATTRATQTTTQVWELARSADRLPRTAALTTPPRGTNHSIPTRPEAIAPPPALRRSFTTRPATTTPPPGTRRLMALTRLQAPTTPALA